MFSTLQLTGILFVDIETASVQPEYGLLPDRLREHWDRKSGQIQRRQGNEGEADPESMWKEQAAIFAEFGQVVCISCGYLRYQEGRYSFHLKSWSGPDEAVLLAGFREVADKWMNPETGASLRNLCAHNGKEFDFPYLGRRYLIRGQTLPAFLTDVQMKKPWEVRLLDTMALWKFGDFKSFTSLDLLCTVLDIPSPKDDMDGSEVGRVFWAEQDYTRIARYCEQDVIATAQVMLRFSGQPLVQPPDIHSQTI